MRKWFRLGVIIGCMSPGAVFAQDRGPSIDTPATDGDAARAGSPSTTREAAAGSPAQTGARCRQPRTPSWRGDVTRATPGQFNA